MNYFLTNILPSISAFGTFAIAVIWLTNHVLGLFIKSVPTYLNEKAKNLATKQDIGEITRQVEGIKLESSKEIELLRSDLQLTNQHKSFLQSEARNSLIDCYSKCCRWIDILTSVDFISLKIEDDYLIKANRLELLYEDFTAAQFKMLLYIDNAELSSLLLNIRQEGLTLQGRTRVSLLKYETTYIAFTSKESDLSNPGDVPAFIETKFKELKEITDEHTTYMIEHYKRLSPKIGELRHLVRGILLEAEQ